MRQDIHIITTGGTIDCAHINEDKVYHFSDSIIPEVLASCGLGNYDHWTHLQPIDSLLMRDDYRENIACICTSVPQWRILITHGTDTLVETAQYLQQRIRDKTIVLVGSMIPAREENTDAEMNLEFALSTLQTTSSFGVYLAMNGQVFSPHNVRKNREKMVFEVIP